MMTKKRSPTIRNVKVESIAYVTVAFGVLQRGINKRMCDSDVVRRNRLTSRRRTAARTFLVGRKCIAENNEFPYITTSCDAEDA